MKRSEMVEIITEVFANYYESICVREAAEEAMQAIERAGMLPPSCCGDAYTSWESEDS